MKKRLYLLMIALLCCTSYLFAQSETPPRYAATQKKFTIATHPLQLLLNNCLRLDFEMRIEDGPGWMRFSQTLYWMEKDLERQSYHYDGKRYYLGSYDFSFREPFSRLRGSGIEVNYKRFLDPRRGLYVAAGLDYTYFDLLYYGGVGEWKSFTQDGLQYHEYSYSMGNHTQNIHRISANHYVGWQIPARHAFLFDAFGGLSYRYSIPTDKNKPSFGNDIFSYGYTGWVVMIGIRLGVGIR
jgi:hypothetical protein